MQQATELKKQLQSIHRKSYPAYKSLKGSYQFGHYILSIDHVQGDPFASPSHISVHISRKDAGFPDAYSKNNLTWWIFFDCLYSCSNGRYITGHKNSFVSAAFSVPGQERNVSGLQHLVEYDNRVTASDHFY